MSYPPGPHEGSPEWQGQQQPGWQGQQQPGWPSQQPAGWQSPHPGWQGQAEPDNYLVWAILTTVLCCLPLGIVSLVYSSRVSGLWAQGRYAEAQTASNNAKRWAIISAIVGAVAAVIFVVVTIGVVAISPSPSTTTTTYSGY